MYPYTQWLMIIIPIKWLQLGIYPIFRQTHIHMEDFTKMALNVMSCRFCSCARSCPGHVLAANLSSHVLDIWVFQAYFPFEWCLVPSGYVKIAIEHDPVEIVDFPINSMVDLSIVM